MRRYPAIWISPPPLFWSILRINIYSTYIILIITQFKRWFLTIHLTTNIEISYFLTFFTNLHIFIMHLFLIQGVPRNMTVG